MPCTGRTPKARGTSYLGRFLTENPKLQTVRQMPGEANLGVLMLRIKPHRALHLAEAKALCPGPSVWEEWVHINRTLRLIRQGGSQTD